MNSHASRHRAVYNIGCHCCNRVLDPVGVSWYDRSETMLSLSVSLRPRMVDVSDRSSSSSSSSGSSNGLRTWLLLLVMLPELNVCRCPDLTLELRSGVEIIDVRTLVSRDIGGTLRGL